MTNFWNSSTVLKFHYLTQLKFHYLAEFFFNIRIFFISRKSFGIHQLRVSSYTSRYPCSCCSSHTWFDAALQFSICIAVGKKWIIIFLRRRMWNLEDFWRNIHRLVIHQSLFNRPKICKVIARDLRSMLSWGTSV